MNAQLVGMRRIMQREETVAGTVSILFHVALFAGLSFSLSKQIKIPDDKPQPMTVSLVQGAPEKAPASSAAIAAPKEPEPKPVEDVKPMAVDQTAEPPVDPVKPVQVAPQADASSLPVGGSEGLIWTPPAPDPNKSALSTEKAVASTRVVLPTLSLGKGAAEPQLVSYDSGRFSDAASVGAAMKLKAGSIVMTVHVDAKGMVDGCDVATSSGSAVLDGKACEVIRSYTYKPAHDQAGRDHPAIVTEVLEWSRDGLSSPPSSATDTAAPSASVPSTAPRPLHDVRR